MVAGSGVAGPAAGRDADVIDNEGDYASRSAALLNPLSVAVKVGSTAGERLVCMLKPMEKLNVMMPDSRRNKIDSA